MIDVLAQATIGEGAALVGGGGVAVYIVSLLVKHGAKLVIGKDPENSKTNGHGNGKSAPSSSVCAAHPYFEKALNERHEALVETLAKIEKGQENQAKDIRRAVVQAIASGAQMKSLVASVSEMGRSVVRLHERMDQVIQDKTTATVPERTREPVARQ